MKLTAALLALWLTAVDCPAQQQPVDLTATPNRPTVTNTAETTQFGVLEIEFGISSTAQQSRSRVCSSSGCYVTWNWTGQAIPGSTTLPCITSV